MSWFFKSRKPSGQQGNGMGLTTGSHRAPGLAESCREMRDRGEASILDLGASSTENVQFFSGFSPNVTVLGLFQSCSERLGSGQRSDIFRFDDEAGKSLPKGQEQFDLVVAWDLLHYFDNAGFVPFNKALSRLCRPGALVYLIAANHAPIYKQPIHFRIEKDDSLFYTLPDVGEAGDAPHLTTRDVEQRMAGFRPLRLFQLRNGMQEFIFRFPGSASEEAGEAGEATDSKGKGDAKPADSAPGYSSSKSHSGRGRRRGKKGRY